MKPRLAESVSQTHRRQKRFRNRMEVALCLCVLSAVAALFLLPSRFLPNDLVVPAIEILIPVSIIMEVVWRQYWRCPSCDQPLRSNRNPNFCPHCGVRLLEAATNP